MVLSFVDSNLWCLWNPKKILEDVSLAVSPFTGELFRGERPSKTFVFPLPPVWPSGPRRWRRRRPLSSWRRWSDGWWSGARLGGRSCWVVEWLGSLIPPWISCKREGSWDLDIDWWWNSEACSLKTRGVQCIVLCWGFERELSEYTCWWVCESRSRKW